jgi:energy-coupling factor transport system ATP-binding protein
MIQFSEINFKYGFSSVAALVNINLTVASGSFVTIMGHNGSGKTSLVQACNRITPLFHKGDFSGIVKVDGEDISKRTIASMAAQIGMIFQDFESQLFSTNANLDLIFGAENLVVPPSEIVLRSDKIIQELHLENILNRYSSTLSGGQKQRLAIASILMMQPKILILDEPTTDLDPESQEEIKDLILQMRRMGHTIILVDHSPEFASYADTVVLMKDGRILAQGAPHEILSNTVAMETCGVRIPQMTAFLSAFHSLATITTPEETAEIMKSMEIFPDTQRYHEIVKNETSATISIEVIELKDVSFSYDATHVLDCISLKIYEGDFIALLGQNGSGKTTLAKIINGLIRPHSGSILFRNQSIEKISPAQRAMKIGYVFQNPDNQIFCPSVREELAFGLKNLRLAQTEIELRIKNALEIIGLEGKAEEDPFILPKGDRQRVAVASVLAMQPEIIILDEPTTGLDYRDQLSMMRLIKSLNEQGHTIVMITHCMSIVLEYARRVIILKSGKILADGGVREVFARTESIESAALAPPPITCLGMQFGMITRSVDEFIHLCHPKRT